MKTYKIIFILSLFTLSQSTVFGQYFGVKLGVGTSGIHAANGNTADYTDDGSPCIGLTYEQILYGKLSISSGVIYKFKQFNFKYLSGYDYGYNDYSYVGEGNSEDEFLAIPFTIDFKLPLSKDIRFCLSGGMSLDILLRDKFLSSDNTSLLTTGIIAKGGFEIGNLCIGAEYDYALTSYSDYGEKYYSYYVTLGYRFGGRTRYFRSHLQTTNF